jgi:hypothetical protein
VVCTIKSSDMVTEEQIVKWINDQEFFWLYDLKTAMGYVHVPYQTKVNETETFIHNFIAKLKRKGLINCIENSGNRKRYHRPKTIVLPLNDNK